MQASEVQEELSPHSIDGIRLGDKEAAGVISQLEPSKQLQKN